VRGTRIVQLNRRTRVTLDEAGVIRKFGVPPTSIPDYLALVGDAADGYRICTPLDIIPGGFRVNSYLIADDEPLLFHTGTGSFSRSRWKP
jgi:hypothetical protein